MTTTTKTLRALARIYIRQAENAYKAHEAAQNANGRNMWALHHNRMQRRADELHYLAFLAENE